MNTYYYAVIDRGDFGNLLSKNGISRLKLEKITTTTFQIGGDVVLAVWSSDPEITKQLPEILVCQDGMLNDWAAWITTYASKIRPFSAYMRLMTNTEFQKNMKRSLRPDLKNLEWPFTGLILGEYLGITRFPDKALETLPATEFMSTLSFAICRAAALYDDYDPIFNLVEMWESVRTITKQRARLIDSASIARVCTIILGALGYQTACQRLTNQDVEIFEACQYIINSAGLTPSNFLKNKLFANAEQKMHGSREERVLAFEMFLNRRDEISASNQEVISFMIGYLASRIAPGSIRHTKVLGQIIDRYPTATLWYGFCSGLIGAESAIPNISQKNSIDFPFSARRIIRELLRIEPIFGVPVADVGYAEVLALSRSGSYSFDDLIKNSRNFVIVELMPGVCISLNISPKAVTDARLRGSKENEIIIRMGEEIERLRDMHKALLGAQGTSYLSKQRPLFSNRNKKK